MCITMKVEQIVPAIAVSGRYGCISIRKPFAVFYDLPAYIK